MAGPNSFYGPLDPAPDAGYVDAPPRMGFFTDTSVCIGCKACEVACKEWNAVPDDGFDLLGQSYDNTGGLTANSWRHVAFIEQSPGSAAPAAVGAMTVPATGTAPGVGPAIDALAAAATTSSVFATSSAGSTSSGCGASSGCATSSAGAASSGCATSPAGAASPAGATQFLGMPGQDLPGRTSEAPREDFRWLMMSNVCKHCTHAGCLDVCPTGALFRTEFGTVVVQSDICNGCGYCVPACPYGVIDRREDDGRAWKCTLCYDRIGDGLTPACAKACPTESIQYGELSELRERAQDRVAQLQSQGVGSARLYGESPDDGVGGDGAFFLLLDEPEVYGLPPDPIVPTRDLPAMYKRAGLAALTMAAAAAVAFLGNRS